LIAGTLVGCGSPARSRQVSIAQVVEQPDVYVGYRITISGVVKRLGARNNGYAIGDISGDTIRLRSPSRPLHEGESITATGTFVLDLGSRPVLEVAAIRDNQD